MHASGEQKFYKVSIFALPVLPSAILKDRIKLDEYLPEDIDDEAIAETRYQILQKLNNAKGVSDLKDVLSKEEKEKHPIWIHTYHSECFRRKPLKDYEKYPIFSFEPVMFSYTMPVALQESLFPAEYPNEDFRIVWDGVSILIAGRSPINKIPSGISDVVEKIISLINEPKNIICRSDGLGLRRDFVFVPDSDIKGAREWDVLIISDNFNEIDSNLKMLYLTLYSFMNELYELRIHLSELSEFTTELSEFQESILKKISEYTMQSSWHVLAKNKIINDIEKMLVNAYIKYSGFTGSRNIYTRMKNDTFQDVLANELLKGFKDDLIEMYESPSFNGQLFLQTLDKAEKIFERYSVNRSNIIAGAIGGIIVSVLAQIISYLLSLH